MAGTKGSGNNNTESERADALEQALKNAGRQPGGRSRASTTVSLDLEAPSSGSIIIDSATLGSSVGSGAFSSEPLAGISSNRASSGASKENAARALETDPAIELSEAQALGSSAGEESISKNPAGGVPNASDGLLKRLALRAEKNPSRASRINRRLARFGIGVLVGVVSTFVVILVTSRMNVANPLQSTSENQSSGEQTSGLDVITIGRSHAGSTSLSTASLVDPITDIIPELHQGQAGEVAADSAFLALASSVSENQKPLPSPELVMSKEELRFGAASVLANAGPAATKASQLGVKPEDRYVRPGVSVDYQGGFSLNDPKGNIAKAEGYDQYLKQQFGATPPKLEALSPEGSKLVK